MNSTHSRSPEFIYIHCVLLFDLAPAKTWTKPQLKLSQPSTFLPLSPLYHQGREWLSAGCQETMTTAARDCLLSSCLPMLRDLFSVQLQCLEAFLVILSCSPITSDYWHATVRREESSWSQLKSRVTSWYAGLCSSHQTSGHSSSTLSLWHKLHNMGYSSCKLLS